MLGLPATLQEKRTNQKETDALEKLRKILDQQMLCSFSHPSKNCVQLAPCKATEQLQLPSGYIQVPRQVSSALRPRAWKKAEYLWMRREILSHAGSSLGQRRLNCYIKEHYCIFLSETLMCVHLIFNTVFTLEKIMWWYWWYSGD